MATVPGFESFNGINALADLIVGIFNSFVQVGNNGYVSAGVTSGAQARGGSGKCVNFAINVPGGNAA